MIKPFSTLLFVILASFIWPDTLLAHEKHEAKPALKSVTRTLSVPPDDFVELNLNLQHGKTILVKFQSNTLLDWNVHSHVGEQSVKHKKGRNKTRSVEFKAPLSGIFSFLWKNKSKIKAKLRVEFNTEKGVEIHSWHPKETTE